MDQLSLSNEEKLLLYCSRLSVDEDIKYKVEGILSHELDWNFVLECASRQGISPLFYWNLKKIRTSKNIPPEIMQELKKRYYNNLSRNILLYDELGKILKAFKQAGIDIIVMKGAFLAEEVYKNIGLRSMSDIDLLIKKDDLQKAKKELNRLMYFSTITFPTKMHEEFQMVLNYELVFINATKKITIDLHWDIQPPRSNYKVNINEFWNNIRQVKIAGVETLTFAPENILQHLCLHLDKHINLSIAPHAKPLRDYCDIAEVTRHFKETINWNYFLKSSNEYKIEEPIFQGLFIAKEYFEALVPEDVLSKLEPPKSNIEFQEIFKELMEGNSRKTNQDHESNYVMDLGLIDGISNKIYILFGNIFPSKEYMMHRYSIKGENQVYRYYLIHLGVAFRWGLAILWQLPRRFLRSSFSK